MPTLDKPVSTFLPIFPGFYNTIFDEGDSFVEFELDDEDGFYSNYPELAGVPFDFIQDNFWDAVDYAKGNLGVVNALVKAVKELLSDFIISIKLEKLVSPKEYNFHNDSVNVEIVPNVQAIRSFIHENWDAFQSFIRKRYTSRDGFMSFHSPDADEWKQDTDDFRELGVNGHVLGAVLEFIAQVKGVDDMALYYATDVLSAFSESVEVNTTRVKEAWEAQKDNKG